MLKPTIEIMGEKRMPDCVEAAESHQEAQPTHLRHTHSIPRPNPARVNLHDDVFDVRLILARGARIHPPLHRDNLILT